MTLPNIEAECIKHRMDKQELTTMLGVTPRTVQNWQNGRVELPLSKLLLLTKMWGLSADYLLGLYIR